MMNKLVSIIICVFLSGGLIAQYTAIPDPIFEEFLISQGLDDVVDGQVLTATISDNTFLQINETDPIFPIEDLTGIQDFVSLEILFIYVTNCTSIDLGDLTNLTLLELSGNAQLEEIDISGCVNLEELYMDGSILNALDVSQNLNLQLYSAADNEYTTLDFSQNSELVHFGVANAMELIDIDFRNGNNENVTFFRSIQNENLSCIFVDDVSYSEANWTDIDPHTTFYATEAECEALSVEETKEIGLRLYPNPAQDFLHIESSSLVQHIRITDATGKQVRTFTGESVIYNLQGIPSGLYFVELLTASGSQTKKLLIQ